MSARHIALFLLFVQLIPALALYEGDSAVKLLTPETFPKMLKSKGIWLVEFFSPGCGHCVSAAPEFEKAAAILDGVIHIAAVDMSQHGSLGQQYGIRGYPTFKLFGEDKSKPTDYQGQRSAQDFVQFCLTQTKQIITRRANKGQGGSRGGQQQQGGQQKRSKSGSSGGTSAGGVIELDDAAFQQKVLQSEEAWFVEFYSPSCGHCKSLEPEWEKLPSLMKDKVRIAKIDATVNQQTAQKYGIKGFPTMLLFPLGSKGQKVSYEGGRTAEEMAQWLATQKIGEEKRELLELSQQNFKKECQRSNVCLLFLLNNKSEVRQLDFLTDIMKKHVSEPVHYLYSAKKHQQLEDDLLISDRQSPKLLAVWPSSNSYKIYNGDLNESSLQEFLTRLFGTRGWIKFQRKHEEYLFGGSSSEL